MSDNSHMSATDAALISSMGNTPTSTLLAVSGGLSGGGSDFRGNSNNALTTLAVAGALSPQSGSSSSSNTLNTVAALSVLGNGNLFNH
jgi:hypothetical protein